MERGRDRLSAGDLWLTAACLVAFVVGPVGITWVLATWDAQRACALEVHDG